MEQEGSLAGPVRELHQAQLREWSVLAQGHRHLSRAVRRSFLLDGWEVEIQLNLARGEAHRFWVREESPGTCFLCAARRPAEQRALRVGRFELLCNPAPLFPEHFTLVWPEHGRRPVAPHLEELLETARALGPGYSLFFNGPGAGASAPDHLHFQAFAAGRLPLERALMGAERPGRGLVAAWSDRGHTVHLLDALGRGVLLVRGRETGAVAAELARALQALAEGGEEPPVNLLARSRGGQLAACLLPRRAHRPACWFAEGEQQIKVSPGAADLAGLLIVARAQDLDRLTPDRIRDVYAEVAWDGGRLAGSLAGPGRS